jgi:hypothetical protein
MTASPAPRGRARGGSRAPRGMSPRTCRNSRRSYGDIRQRTPGRWEARDTGPVGVRRPIGAFESEKAALARHARPEIRLAVSRRLPPQRLMPFSNHARDHQPSGSVF